MKKYFTKEGKEVKLGDKFIAEVKKKNMYSRIEVTVTRETLPCLISFGYITEKEVQDKIPNSEFINGEKSTIGYYINKIALRLNWNSNKTVKYLDNINNIYPKTVFDILLKEIAIELDKKYEDHITKSPNIYGISSINGEVVKLDKNAIVNYKNFAAFRTEEDAHIATIILNPIMKEIFMEHKCKCSCKDSTLGSDLDIDTKKN